ncbi:MAG: putative manganese transporter [Lachnospiraceae bacterium]|jgi:hypothetical protein
MAEIFEVILEVCIDTLKLIPFLFLTYLLMEFLEHKTEEKTKMIMEKSGKLGPVLGSIVGVVPQCGFSATSSSLFSGGMITVGTLLAVFLSTSDEMIPIFISETVPVASILKVVAAKFVIGAVSGLVIDMVIRIIRGKNGNDKDFHDLCEREHCGCEEDEKHGILLPALKHTIHITVFIFVVTLAVAILVYLIGEQAIADFLISIPGLGIFLAGIIGLIPNCASSVMLTELYLSGMLTTGPFMAGILCASGMGLLVLFRTNGNVKENIRIMGILYAIAVFWGFLIQLLGISFI